MISKKDKKKILKLIERCWYNINRETKFTMEIQGDTLNWINEEKIKYEMSRLLNTIDKEGKK